MKASLAVLAAVGVFAAGEQVHAQVAFWDAGDAGDDFGAPANWDTNIVPGVNDLAVINNPALPAVQVTSNQTVDSLRLSDGGAVVQSGGTLTIASTSQGGGDQFPDNGLWVGEFGPAATSYTINGGSLVINDAADGFMVGRGSTGTFNLNAGAVSNTVGDTHIGLDGAATWNQSSGTFNGAGVQVGRFQSPTATVNLSGDATFNAAGLLLLSDGADGFANAIRSDLNITGSTVTIAADGLILRDKANLSFTADSGGISTITLGAAPFEIQSSNVAKSGLLVDLTAYASVLDDIVLIDSARAVVGTFDGLAEGAVVPNTGGRTITYSGGADGFDIVLQAVPEPASLALLAMGGLLVGRRRAR